MKKLSNKANNRGFGLLEVIVAVVLTGMIALALYSSFQAGTRVLKRTVTEVEPVLSQLDGQRLLRHWLSLAYPLDPDRNPLELIEPIAGQRSEISFTSSINPAVRENDLYRVRIWHDAARAAVMIQMKPDRNASTDVEFSDEVPFISGVDGVLFNYLDHGSTLESQNWLQSWGGQDYPPQAMRVQISYSDDSVQWPDLLIRPMITGRMNCVFDTISRRCR